MTIVRLFTYRQYVIYIYTYRSYVRNVGALKVVNLHCSRQQCVVVEWSGRSVAVTVRAQGQGMEFFPSLFFFSLCKSVRKKLCRGTV